MPSSTSSSEPIEPSDAAAIVRPIPAVRWGGTWLVAVVLAATGVIAAERYVRALGYAPQLNDDPNSWAAVRAQVSDGSPTTVALLGTSRMALGFSAEGFARAVPDWRYAQLAVFAKAPVATLRDLAADPSFRGVAVVDLDELGFDHTHWADQAPYVQAYQRRWSAPGVALERWLMTKVEMASALPTATGSQTLRLLILDGFWRRPSPLVVRADRTAVYRSEHYGAVKCRAALEGLSPSPEAWLADARAVEPAIVEIQARGGRVVLVHMPDSGAAQEETHRVFPRDRYWDVFARETAALTIHFDDDPVLRGFHCPDGIHLDSRDAPAFTERLFTLIRAKIGPR